MPGSITYTRSAGNTTANIGVFILGDNPQKVYFYVRRPHVAPCDSDSEPWGGKTSSRRIADFGLRIVLIEKLFVNSESEIRNRNQRALLRVCVVNRALEFSSLPSRNFVELVTA